MLRRDYILRMIQEFMEAISRINSLKTEKRWDESSQVLRDQFLQLVGRDANSICRLSENELVALLMKTDPVSVVRDKTLMVTALLKEQGDLAASQGKQDESRDCYLKGLHLLMRVAGSEDFELPQFVPTIDLFVQCLQNAPLPGQTLFLLMQHYERTAQFAKAEDALYELLELEPSNPDLIEFGISFYERLLRHPDRQLQEGNLPRTEVDSALRALRERTKPAVK
jgi:tetratricopeptide (TPR) repeat protein